VFEYALRVQTASHARQDDAYRAAAARRRGVLASPRNRRARHVPAARRPESPGLFGWFLRTRPLQRLGRLPYSIYLIHTPVHFAMLLLMGGAGLYTPDRWGIAFAVSIQMTLALSQLS
jgi:hypothetical protein